MQYPTTIVVLLQEGNEGLTIASGTLSLGNHKGLTKGMIMEQGAEEEIVNSDRHKRLLNNDNE
jgi:hypothetical protein